ncbi:MAG: hypothetical protein A3F26_03640 [Candidatus Ryanbacteria bacterium RIFCSPHIGHO2_12_FULL_47_12b]|uniref:FAD dependent oxidoreductase domain-containing protein n=2 Tax=Candidatus Ryaniibacteriota TaxID=1817914 RepID=A0A1G2H635_9BACT|nr:MAG: hypothetical protein UX74_C0019G0007 [Parcubacteria group bacterium GW2011_GWA2_47_10b]OGZ46264.1 MAG: hypothetical protein A2844_01740 [Candidatus Ryanbacteria bacterium RIFCSPHIGHO2_01_FULL_48_80]OGZ50507.1 MAG: hypothetical protein A3C83_02140 [Candidatus Ryanbacteria bacterium RIFCSPHIGHO2_02_FULL_47_25]OGZ52374.1 MAG: hypothetical protein A3A29_02360 [Candidatus Ryanbacteria bacterium RIFCSPLOWO2_01_FULL_47_79]OGZ53195.1 MAG: hypothetical protein A3F26_03640 [Candidatus Ryanbacteri
MKIGVVGGGIFGITAAWLLAREGHAVDLYEREDDILKAASSINQYRLHRGFHYPRSRETILLTRDGEKSFRREYENAIVKDPVEHYYAIAREGGHSSAKHCLSVWDECGLSYDHSDVNLVNADLIEKTVRVEEDLIDPYKLKEVCKEKLATHNVNVLLNTEATRDDLERYDYAVIATYANNNALLEHMPHAQKLYQFELCEKPVLKLPSKFQGKSIVVIDGPFMCIDPMGSTGYHVMGNVVHAIHAKNIGKFPIAPPELQPFLNKGVIKNPPITNISKFLAHAAQYMPGVEQAEHIGSMYTFRTKPPYHEHDDARPTTVDKIDGNIIVVFSGKIPTCVDAAKEVLKIVQTASS